MAAPAQNRSNREVVEFPPNVPVTIALKFAQGRMISNERGERMMFTTVDNRVLFLDLDVAQQIGILNINVREPFTITKQQGAGKNAPITWAVARPGAAPQPSTARLGEQPDGTFVVPKLAEPKPMQRATAATGPTEERREAVMEFLVAESKHAVDAYAAVLEHALTTHHGRVKPDEVKSIFLTVMINCTGKGRAA